jgi:hypothetical protein
MLASYVSAGSGADGPVLAAVVAPRGGARVLLGFGGGWAKWEAVGERLSWASVAGPRGREQDCDLGCGVVRACGVRGAERAKEG